MPCLHLPRLAPAALWPPLAVLASAAGAAAQVRASVPIRTEQNLVLVPISVAGSTSFHVVLDTGMATRGILLYRSERVDALPLEFAEAPGVSGAGGSGAPLPTRVAEGGRIELGGLALDGVPVITLPVPPGFPRSHDGIIGSELFERFAVRIDVDEQRLLLLESAALVPEEGSSAVPLRFRGGAPFLEVRVAVGADEPVSAELALDLGATHALWLNSGREPRFRPPAGAFATRLGRGLSGDVEGHVGRVRRLELGGFAFEDMVAVFPSASQQHPGGVDFRDGFLGSESLSRFRLTFDYSGQRLFLAPGARYRAPFEHDMTGMVLDPTEDGARVVRRVLADSPAAEAGILGGDVLLAIDGRPVSELGADGVARSFRVEGAEVELELQRGGTEILKRIRLRRLI